MKSKKICRLLGIGLLTVLMALSFIAAASFTDKMAVIAAAEKDLGYFNRSSDDVTVTEGVDLKTDFTTFAIDDWTAGQLVAETSNRVNNGFSSYLAWIGPWQAHKASLYQTKKAYAAAEGATLRLIDNYNGVYTMMGYPVMSGGRNLELGEADYKRYDIVIRDKNDANNVIEMQVNDNGLGNSDMTIVYGDTSEILVAPWDNGLYAPFRANTTSGNLPFHLKFDPVGKTVRTTWRIDGENKVELNLATTFPEFKGFEEYSVDFIFRNVNTDTENTTSDGIARFYMMELCGQTLYYESAGIPDDGKPYISVDYSGDISEIYVGDTITVPEATAHDMISTAEITATAVIDPDGTEVNVNNGKFVPAKTGKYTVTYTATDGAATTHTAERSITFTLDALFDPADMESGYIIPAELTAELDLDGSIIPEIETDAKWSYTMKIYAASDTERTTPLFTNDYEPVFASTGDYVIVYHLVLHGNENNSKNVETLLAIQDTKAPRIDSVNVGTAFEVGDELTIPAATAYDRGDGEVSVTYKLMKGTEEQTVVNDKFTFTAAGEYKLIYTATDRANNKVEKPYTITVAEVGGYTIPDSLTVELDKDGCVLPALVVESQWTYLINVYNSGDTEFTAPLAENVSEYAFTSTGEYLLRYQLILNGDINFSKFFAVPLTVEHTLAPVISDVSVESSYKVGQTLSVPVATAQDKADGEVNVTVTLKKGDTNIAIVEGKVTFTEAGEYTLTYTATDSANKTDTKEFTITVSEDNTQNPGGDGGNGEGSEENGDGGCKGSVGGLGVMGATLAVACTVIVLRKKEN